MLSLDQQKIIIMELDNIKISSWSEERLLEAITVRREKLSSVRNEIASFERRIKVNYGIIDSHRSPKTKRFYQDENTSLESQILQSNSKINRIRKEIELLSEELESR